MIHEKIFHLKSGREVKIVVKGFFLNDSPQVSTEYEVLIKDPKETFFRTPIGTNHPQYWKMRRLTTQQAKLLLLEYSGLTQRQVNIAITEFNKIASFPPAQIGLQYENELV